MKIAQKIGFIISLLAAVVVASCLAIAYWINANEVVSVFSQQLKRKTGIELTVAQAHWSFFPWLGIKLEQVNLRHPETGQLAHLDELRTKVALLPLLEKKVHIGEIGLVAPQLMLTKNLDGSYNWSRLAKSIQALKEEQPEEDKTKPHVDMTLDKIELTKGQLNYLDATTQTHYLLTELNFSTEQPQLKQRFPVNLSFELSQPKKLSLQLALKTRLLLDPEQQIYELQQLDIHSQISLANKPMQKLTLNSPDIRIDLAHQQINSKNIHLTGDGFTSNLTLQVSQLNEQPQISGVMQLTIPQLRTLMNQWGIRALAAAGPQQLQKMQMSTHFHASKEALQLSQLTLLLDQSKIQGSLGIRHFSQPAINAQLAINQLNLDHYFPPSPSNPSSTETTTANENKPLLPLDTLRKLNVDLNLRIGTLIAKQMAIQQASMNISGHQGTWYLSHCQGGIFQGHFACTVSLNAQSAEPSFIVHKNLSDIQLALLMQKFTQKDFFSGLLDFDGQLTTRGNTMPLVLKNLNGTSQLTIKQGVIKGVNISQLVFNQLDQFGPVIQNYLQEKAQKKLPPSLNKDTQLKTFTTQAQFKDGIVHLQHIDTRLDKANAAGDARINLLANTLDLHLGVQLDESISNKYVAQIIWPVHCSGPLNAAPKCSVETRLIRKQLEKLAKRTLEEKAKAALLKKLNLPDEAAAKALARQKIEEKKQQLQQKVDAQKAQLQQKVDQEKDKVEEQLKNKLKGLFR